MEYKVFERIFKGIGLVERQIKKLRERSYKEYEDCNGKKIATGGQKKMAYDFLVQYLRELELEDLVNEMYSICKASREQSEKLYDVLNEAYN